MNFKDFFLLNEVKIVGYQEIVNLFGPLYHGTSQENHSNILKNGFRVPVGLPSTGDTAHGYQFAEYNKGYPPPIHHLGYGVYFTQSLAIAKMYNHNTAKNLKAYYIDAARIETINFASPNTMMKWWRNNGYNMPSFTEMESMQLEEKQKLWIQATQNLTDNLKSKYDAILFKGKGFGSLLDGNQICVYDTNKIYLFDPQLNNKNDYFPGDRVKIKNLPIALNLTGRSPVNENYKNIWSFVFNQPVKFNYSTNINLKQIDLIKEKYTPNITQISQTNEHFLNFIHMRMKNSGNDNFEASLKNWVDHVFQSLKYQIPDVLIEEKLAKGQRIK